jgi:hypothetical protein
MLWFNVFNQTFLWFLINIYVFQNIWLLMYVFYWSGEPQDYFKTKRALQNTKLGKLSYRELFILVFTSCFLFI